MSNRSSKVAFATNVKTLGEEADLEALTFNLVQMPIGSTNVQFSTKTAFCQACVMCRFYSRI